MKRSVRLIAVVFIALLVILLATSSPFALRSISVTGEGALGETTQSVARALTFGGTELASSRFIICEITLLRQITKNPMPKTVGTVFGKVIGVGINIPRCAHGTFIEGIRSIVPLRAERETRVGEATLFTLNPGWEQVYDSFSGTLPEITGISTHIARFAWSLNLTAPIFGNIECLYEGSTFTRLNVERRRVTSAEFVLRLTALARISGSGLCPERLTLSGNMTTPSTEGTQLI